MENKLKELRKQKGYTQKQVAAMLGLQCENRLSHWEMGTAVPSVKNLFKLCKIYVAKIDEIYTKQLDS